MSENKFQDVQEATAMQQTVINGVTIMLQMLAKRLSEAKTAAELKEMVDQMYTDANALAHAVAANTPHQDGAGTGAPATGPTPPAAPAEEETEVTDEDHADEGRGHGRRRR